MWQVDVSPPKKLEIERSIAFHLGFLKRKFETGEICEDSIENADETHLVFNMDNGKKIAFIEDKEIKYVDVASRGEQITMMVRITGGRNATIYHLC